MYFLCWGIVPGAVCLLLFLFGEVKLKLSVFLSNRALLPVQLSSSSTFHSGWLLACAEGIVSACAFGNASTPLHLTAGQTFRAAGFFEWVHEETCVKSLCTYVFLCACVNKSRISRPFTAAKWRPLFWLFTGTSETNGMIFRRAHLSVLFNFCLIKKAWSSSLIINF